MAIEIDKIKVGDRVYYQSKHKSSVDKGIVKSIADSKEAVFVVYACNQDWDNYQDYTGVRTRIEDLFYGWNPQLDEILCFLEKYT
jgi:hypothetical protein